MPGMRRVNFAAGSGVFVERKAWSEERRGVSD
jgi:hypothetical protein